MRWAIIHSSCSCVEQSVNLNVNVFHFNETTNVPNTGEGRRRVISPPCFCIRPARKRGMKQKGQRWRDGNLHHAGTSHFQNTRKISVDEEIT